MKTDHEIYQFLSIGPKAFRALTGIALHGAYTFSAPVLKSLERRIDAVFEPKDSNEPVYIVEFQVQWKPTAWYNLLTKIGLYGENNYTRKIKGVLIVPKSTVSWEESEWIAQATSQYLSIVYLEEVFSQLSIQEPNNPFVAVLAPLLIKSDEELQQMAPNLWHTVHDAKEPEETRVVLEQILQTWFFERFKHLSEEEVLDMLPVLAPLEETRAYKSIFAKGMAKGEARGKAEGKAEGEARGKAELLKRLIQRRFKQLPKWAVAKIDKADVMQLDAWAEAIFDAQDIETLLNS